MEVNRRGLKPAPFSSFSDPIETPRGPSSAKVADNCIALEIVYVYPKRAIALPAVLSKNACPYSPFLKNDAIILHNCSPQQQREPSERLIMLLKGFLPLRRRCRSGHEPVFLHLHEHHVATRLRRLPV